MFLTLYQLSFVYFSVKIRKFVVNLKSENLILILSLRQYKQTYYKHRHQNKIVSEEIKSGMPKLQQSKQYLKYKLTQCRTQKSYLIFQIFQLILSVSIIIGAAVSDDLFRETYVLALELVLLLSMIFDLFVIRMFSEGSLFKSDRKKNNILDLCIIIVFVITFIFLCATQSKKKQSQQPNEPSSYQLLLQADDIVLIIIISLRYLLQLYQMVKTIRNTTKNIQMQRKMKDVDLNNIPHISMVEENNDHLQDEIFRKRMQQRSKKDVLEAAIKVEEGTMDMEANRNQDSNKNNIQLKQAQ